MQPKPYEGFPTYQLEAARLLVDKGLLNFRHEWTHVRQGWILITECEIGQAKQQIPEHIYDEKLLQGDWDAYRKLTEQVNEEAIQKSVKNGEPHESKTD